MTSNRIRERRIALRLSQVQLGILTGIPNSMISDFELEKRKPWPKARKALARALKVSEAELFGNNEDH
jgi:transcriptional regulator with XRE-family HTH domain